MAARRDREVNQLIQDVVEASKLPPKARPTNIKPTVADLTSLAYEQGLLPDALSQLVELVTSPSYLDQASLTLIVRNLYPATQVTRHVILRVLSCFGHGKLKPSLNVQAALLRWLILVYHVLESPAVLSQAYTVLFNLLDTAATRPHLSHLLALITRRKHVRPFRIQMLLGMSRQTGNDPCLVGLLRVFKDYYPEIIVGEAVRGKAAAFKHPDPQWRTRLDEVQEAHLQQTQDGHSRSRDGFRVNRPTNRAQRSKVIPAVHTSHATESSVTLEEVENATGLAQNIDKIELPNQLIAVLADPLLQKLMLLRPNEQAYQRVANWLNSVLQEVLDGDADEGTLWEVLDVLRDYVTQTKASTLPPLILNFFARFFQQWNGSGPQECVMDILSYAPFRPFQELLDHIFVPLEQAIAPNMEGAQLVLLHMYTRLLHHWTSILKSKDEVPAHASESITLLMKHANFLSLTLLQISPTVSSQSSILELHEQFVRLVTDPNLTSHIRIELPLGPVIYAMLFSNSLATVSRLCHVLACYKRGFEAAMSNRARRDSGSSAVTYDRAYVGLYNGYLMDMCNCFWRGRALDDGDNNAHGCLVPRTTVVALSSYVSSIDKTFSLASLFSLSHAPVLCLQSIETVRRMEDDAMEEDGSIRTRHAGPVTQSSLTRLASSGGVQLSWQEYRISVLEHLSNKGLVGVTELLKNTMTVLKKSMEARPQATLQ